MRFGTRDASLRWGLLPPLAIAAVILVGDGPLRAQSVPLHEGPPVWLARVAEGPLARAHWGVAVYDLADRRWVALYDADRYFVPASNLKLVVTAVALERLGPAYTWRTSIYGSAPVGRDGTLRGDLVLYGRGDPNLSGRFAGTITAVFEALADSLAARGLRRVSGALLADESHWDTDYLRGEWESYDTLWWYAAPVGALGFNDNAVDFAVRPGSRVGERPVVEGQPESEFWTLENRAETGPPGAARTFDLRRVPGTNRIEAYGVLPLDADPRTEYFAVIDPAGWAGTVFREVLAQRGITIEGPVRVVSEAERSPVAAGDTIALAAWISPPLERVVETVNQRSQNWHAEMVLKTLGREIAGEGSWPAGFRAERSALAALGVDTTAFLLRDASGLAAENLVTPRALVELLAAARRRPWGTTFLASLPVAAGSTGSLRSRFANTVGAGRVRAKTGFIENVYALAGYLTTLAGREIAFSVIVNQTGTAGGAAATAAIDRLVNDFVSGAAP
ncbi:MAG: D-alanyl-D-alanine carboxypeptidase/D-alanyl-D-alanine-endopeptidase [Gemmatimonadota bacterium]